MKFFRLQSIYHLFVRTLCAFALFVPTHLAAETISSFQFQVFLPGGSTPAEFVNIEIIDENFNPIDFATTDTSGMIFSSEGFEEGTEYRLKIDVQNSNFLTENGKYRNHVIEVTPSKAHSEYQSGSDTYVVPSFTLGAFPRLMKVVVTDEVSSPIIGYKVDAYSPFDPSKNIATYTNSLGEAFIGVGVGDNDPRDLFGYDPMDNFGTFSRVESPMIGQTETVITVRVAQTDAQIVGELFDESNTPYIVGTNELIRFECLSRTSANVFSQPIPQSGYSATLELVADEYDCFFHIDGQVTLPQYVLVSTGGSEFVSEVVTSRDSQITAKLLDSTNADYFLGAGEIAHAECYDELTSTVYSKNFEVGTSSVTLQVLAGDYDCHIFYQGFRSLDQEITVTDTTPQTFSHSILQADSSVVGELLDPNGDPLIVKPGQFGFLSCYNIVDFSYFSRDIPVGFSSVSLPLLAGTYDCFIDLDGSGGINEQVTIASGDSATVQYQAEDRSAQITVKLADEQGDPRVLQGVEYAGANCYHQASARSYFKDFDTGYSELTLDVVPGLYSCHVYFNGSGGADRQVAVTNGGSQELTYTVRGRDAVVRFRAIDATTGEEITGLSIDYNVSASNPHGESDFRFKNSSDGSVVMNLFSDLRYTVSLFLPIEGDTAADIGSIDFDGKSYSIVNNYIDFIPHSGNNDPVDVELQELNTFVEVTVRDKDGELIPSGWVDIAHFSFSESGEGPNVEPSPGPSAAPTPDTASPGDEVNDLYYGAQIVNGQAKVGVLPGKEYEVRVFPNTDPGARQFPPPVQMVTPSSGQTIALDFGILEPNYNLTLTTVLSEQAEIISSAIQDVFCYANNPTDQFTEGFATSEKVTLELRIENPRKPNLWNIHCHAIVTEGSEERFYFGELIYRPKRQASEDEVTITLADEGQFFEEESKTFNSGTDNELTIAGGVALGLPKGALPQSSSAVVKTGTAKGYRAPTNSKVLGALNIEFTINGQDVDQLDSGATLCFPVDEDELQEQYGVDASAIYIASYNETTDTWTKGEVDTTVNRADDGSVSVCTSSIRHFSIWGQIIDYIKAAREAECTDLKSRKTKKKKQKKKRIRFTWTAPTSATDITTYEVDVLRTKKRVSKKRCAAKTEEDWAKATTYETVGAKLTQRLRRGKYCWRTRVKDGKNPDPKSFKLKQQ